jgi:hypothetical protein
MQCPNARLPWPYVVLALVLQGIASGGAALLAATDIQVNSAITAGDQAETAIVVSPADPHNLFAAWIDDRAGRVAIGHAYSLDGGLTWTDSVYDDPRADILYDPSVAADSLGNFYLAVGIDFLPAGSGSAALLLKSTDGGATLGPPVTIGPIFDKPFMAVDRPSNVVYVIGNAPNDRGKSGTSITRSTDGGATFSPLVQISQRTAGAPNTPAFGNNGEIYVSWPFFAGGQSVKVMFNRSLDGGATWLGRDTQVAAFKLSTTLLNGNIRAVPLTTVAVDRGMGPFRGRIYIVWNQPGTGTSRDVVLSSSSDGGNTWSATVRVNDDATASDQFLSWVNVDQAGRVNVTFLDRRDDPGNVNFSLYRAVSVDGGATFQSNTRISDGGFPPVAGNAFVGDYNAADIGGGMLHMIWADARNGSLDVFTEAVSVIGL